MSNKVPQLRFNGYSEAWVQRKLTDITKSYSGLTYKPEDIQESGTFVLRSSNVKNGQLVDADNVYVNSDVVNSKNVEPGDVVVVVRNGSRSLIGKHAIVTNEMPNTVIGAFMSAFRGENGTYVNALLSTENFDREVNKSLGATINQITGKDFSMMKFATPELSEQQEIGSFFAKLDEVIAANQRKLDLLKEQKKGYLQKMFPKNGAKAPELRFSGFADDWEERKLADVVSISAGGDVDKTKLIEDGGYPVLANALTNSGVVGYYDSYKVEAPAVTVTGRGDVGHAVSRHVNFTPVVRLLSLKSKVLDADFLANMLNQTNILVESTGVPQLTAPQLGSYKILYPNLNEQTKIGKLLNAFDNLIAANQRKLDLLRKQKKGYLQKMFV